MSINPPFRPGTGLPAWLLVMSMATLTASCGQQPRSGNAAEPATQAAASPSPIPWATIEAPTPPAQAAVPAGTPRPGNTAAPPQFVFPKGTSRAAVKTFSGVGVVRSINFEEGWLEIDHEEIKDFMPAMQMEWTVRDRSMLKSVQVGDKVNFKGEDHNGTQFLTELRKVTAAP